MFLLDTNVVSELRKAGDGRADPNVIAWQSTVDSSSFYISSVTLWEIEVGILRIERRDAVQGARLRKWMNERLMLQFAERVLPIDATVAFRCAGLHVPHTRSDNDAWIAATALVALFDPLVDAAEHDAMLVRASLDLRANRLRSSGEELATIFPEGEPIAGLADGWRLPGETAAVQHAAYAEGRFEVQDAASQYAAAALDAHAGQSIVDLCAGGGGKTLAIASATGDAADILACDTNRARLQQLSPRAERAGATRIETRLLNPGKEHEMLADWQGRADRVFVDAPCSGSGTWRRSPELRWRLTPSRLDRHLADQAKLIELGADLVAPGGKLLYAVCSIIAREGRAQVDDFLHHHPGWTADTGYLPDAIGRAAGAGFLLTPAHDRSDGFFLARLTAPC